MAFQGTVSRRSERVVASAPIIDAVADTLVLTGTAAIATINPKTGSVGNQQLALIPLAAATLVATGNIAVAVVMVVNRVHVLEWSDSQSKWYPQIAAV